MLINFSVRNFRTFKERVTLSLLASNYDKDTLENDNISVDKKFNLRILKSAAMYGANASGKSKFIEALVFMRHFVLSSSKESQKGDPIPVVPFRLNIESENAPSEFEVVFTFKDIMFRYGFEVDTNRVVSEWLYYKPNTKEIELFYRDFQEFALHPRNFSKGNAIIKDTLVRDNALLISVAAQFNDATSIAVIEWFRSLKIISGLNEEGYRSFTLDKIDDSSHKQKILELLQSADLAIQDITPQTLDIDKLPGDMPEKVKKEIRTLVAEKKAPLISDITTLHKKYDSASRSVGNVNFSFDNDESSGTRKFFYLTGPILDVIENGYTLIIDELDSRLHPNLVCKIVTLFNSFKFNNQNAQLIFNTHNTNLLTPALFRRDQVWFVEKNNYGEARLYSLADFKSNEVRKTEPFEDNYLRGKYGAVPFLSDFESTIKSLAKHENKE
jgi:AAA15 family ATPase/GTPase